VYLRRPAGRRLVERVALFCTRPWAIFLLSLPVALIEAAHRFEITGGWSRYAYVPFILYGYLFAADSRFGQALQRQRTRALVLGIVTFLIYMGGQGMLVQVGSVDPFTGRDLASLSVRWVKGLAGWFWVAAIMGLAGHMSQRGARRRQRAPEVSRDLPSQPDGGRSRPSLVDRAGAYARDAQLPFYVLHYAPVVAIGHYVVQWPISALVKYLVIALSSLAVTLVLYDIGVRRTRVTRFLFGMRDR
jgi:glucan biosynthesis protein C